LAHDASNSSFHLASSPSAFVTTSPDAPNPRSPHHFRCEYSIVALSDAVLLLSCELISKSRISNRQARAFEVSTGRKTTNSAKPLCASSLDLIITRSQDVGSGILVRPVRSGMRMAWYAHAVDLNMRRKQC
jgi:hypothetical protein